MSELFGKICPTCAWDTTAWPAHQAAAAMDIHKGYCDQGLGSGPR